MSAADKVRGATLAQSEKQSGRGFMRGKSALVLAIAIIATSYGLFFYLQGIVENDFRQSLFEQQQTRQVESTKAIAQHIASDLDSISTRLEIVAATPSIKSGDLGSERTAEILERVYDEIESKSILRAADPDQADPVIDGIYIVNSDGIVTVDVRPHGGMSIAGTDVSSRSYVIATKSYLAPQFSPGYMGHDNVLRIAATYPIVSDSGDYMGMVVLTTPTKAFFQHYGNIYDIQSQYMAVLDNDATQLVHPVSSFIGTSFFGELTQNATGHNEVLNDQIRRVIEGTPSSSIYEFVNGERFNTGHPITFRDQPTYFVFVVTPTSVIYSTIDGILSTQRVQTFTVLAGTTVSIGILIFLLARWNSGLNKEVTAKISEISESNARLIRLNSQLEESNRQLAMANEKMIAINMQLQRSEKTQKEFINVAAHELRTPIQPILGLAEVMHSRTTDPEMLDIIDTIERNARRLLHLSSDILDAARIEGHELTLNKHDFELNELLLRAVQENLAQFQSRNVRFSFEPGSKAMVHADKVRISQVITNLLSNAAKFTQAGQVTVSAWKQDSEALVTVKDTGTGIDSDILPRLFTKFATKSEKGTGLGLFISKSIVEAHGGRIWGQNNPEGRGAIFGFSLPLSNVVSQPEVLVEPTTSQNRELAGRSEN